MTRPAIRPAAPPWYERGIYRQILAALGQHDLAGQPLLSHRALDLAIAAPHSGDGLKQACRRLRDAGHLAPWSNRAKGFRLSASGQPLGHRLAAADRLPALPRVGERTCLRCRRAFRSRGPGNRICPACKDSQAWRDAGELGAPL